MRDVLQWISLLVSVITLVAIFRRTRKYGERRSDWLAFIVISILTMIFYIAVFIDQQHDVMNASDVSSTLRMAVQGILLAFVLYSPRRIAL
jgi:hypothetical protein